MRSDLPDTGSPERLSASCVDAILAAGVSTSALAGAALSSPSSSRSHRERRHASASAMLEEDDAAAS